MLLLLAIRLVVLGYGAYGCIRGKYAPGFVLLVPALMTVAFPFLVLIDVTPVGASFLVWLAPLVAAASGSLVTRDAFLRLNEQRAESERATQLETASFAMLANALIDTAIFVLAGAAMALLGRDDF